MQSVFRYFLQDIDLFLFTCLKVNSPQDTNLQINLKCTVLFHMKVLQKSRENNGKDCWLEAPAILLQHSTYPNWIWSGQVCLSTRRFTFALYVLQIANFLSSSEHLYYKLFFFYVSMWITLLRFSCLIAAALYRKCKCRNFIRQLCRTNLLILKLHGVLGRFPLMAGHAKNLLFSNRCICTKEHL